MTESDQTGARAKPFLRDWRDWNSLLALGALLLTIAALFLAYDGVGGWWPLRVSVSATCFAMAANAVSRNRAS